MAGGSQVDRVNPYRARDVLQLLVAQVAKSEVEFAGSILLHARRDADAAWLGQAFKAGRDVDPVTEDVTVLDDDVALMDADPQFDAAVRRNALVVFGDPRLDLAGAAQGVDGTGEFGKETIAGGLDHPAVVGGDARIDQFATESLQAR